MGEVVRFCEIGDVEGYTHTYLVKEYCQKCRVNVTHSLKCLVRESDHRILPWNAGGLTAEPRGIILKGNNAFQSKLIY